MKVLDLTQDECNLLVLALIDAQTVMGIHIKKAIGNGEKALANEWKKKKDEYWKLERKINRTIC